MIYFRAVDPEKGIILAVNFFEATSQLSQTTLRAMLGKHELDDMLAEPERLNIDIEQVLDARTDTWGIKVSNVEIKHVDLAESMICAFARQGEAERERRAKAIHAEGEQQASEKLGLAVQWNGYGKPRITFLWKVRGYAKLQSNNAVHARPRPDFAFHKIPRLSRKWHDPDQL